MMPSLSLRSLVLLSLAVPLFGAGLVVCAQTPEQVPQAGDAYVRRIAAQTDDKQVVIRVSLSRFVPPVATLLSHPDRLVLDFANVQDARGPQRVGVNSPPVSTVRMALFQAAPPVTRVVLDLDGAVDYKVQRSENDLLVSVARRPHDVAAGSGPRPVDVALTSGPQPRGFAVGAASATGSPSPSPAIAARVPQPHSPVMQVRLAGGNLRIVAKGNTFADLLSAIAARTNAQVEFPAEAANDKVAVELGPAPVRAVLEDLLRGSPYNYVIVGGENGEPLRQVSLTRRKGGEAPPAAPTPPTPPAPMAPEPVAIAPPPEQPAARFTVSIGGSGTGTFVMTPPGTSCAGNCVENYAVGSTVTVTAQPADDSVFASWNQCDSITGTSCTVTLSSDRSVLGIFSLASEAAQRPSSQQ